MQNPRLESLLIVEDEQDHANLIINVLQKEGKIANDILWVKNGQEAIDYFLKCKEHNSNNISPFPALVLLDVKMPLLNGFEVLEWIKSNENYKHIPVIMLTTSGNSEDAQKALKLGANDYIVKPVIWSDFESKVRGIGNYWAMISNACLYNSKH